MKKTIAALLVMILLLMSMACASSAEINEINDMPENVDLPDGIELLDSQSDDPEDLPSDELDLENDEEEIDYLTEEEFDAIYFSDVVEIEDEFYVHGRFLSERTEDGLAAQALSANPSDPITTAYITKSNTYLYINTVTDFTVTVEGGVAPYTFTYDLYYQSFSTTTRSYQRVNHTVSLDNTYSYQPTNAGRYALLVKVVDAQGSYVAFHGGIMITAYKNDTSTSTVRGLVNYVVNAYTSAGDSDYQKALALHNWLCLWTEYSVTRGYYEADSSLLYKQGVCSGYAGAYQLLCETAGLECLIVHGYGRASATSGYEHAWNLVKIDGDWYHVDCTWDDGGGNSVSTAYFLLPDSVMSNNHYWDYSALDATSGSMPVSSYMPRCTATYYTPAYSNAAVINRMTMSASTISVAVNGVAALSVTTSPTTCRMHAQVWSSSDESVVTVNDYGLIEGISDGVASVYCRDSSGACSAVCTVTVGSGNSGPFSVVQSNANQATLKWKAASGASGYTIYRSTSRNGTYTSLKSVTGTSTVCTNLTDGTTYYFKIRPYKTVNGSRDYSNYEFSDIKSVTIVAGPAAPNFTSLTNTTPITTKLVWSAVSGADGYTIYRSTKSATEGFSAIKSCTGTTEYNFGLTNSTTYYYKIRAYKMVSGNRIYGEYSNVKTITMPLDSAIAKPVIKSISQTAAGTVTLTYNAVANAAGYTLYYSTSANGTYTAVKSVTGTSVVKINLTVGTTYYFKIRAYREINSYRSYGEYSNVSSIKITY